MTTPNMLFDAYRDAMVGTTSNYTVPSFLTATIKAGFVDEGVAVPVSTNVFVTSFSTALVPAFASMVTLASPSIHGVPTGANTPGTVDANDTTFTALTGSSVEGIIVIQFVSTIANSPNLAYFATGVTGVPFTPSGGDVTIQWNVNGLWQV